MSNKKICWWSGGVSSFIAGYLVNDTIDEWIYIDIGDQHPDTYRFKSDCEKLLGRKITTLRSTYKNVDEACRGFNFIRHVNGYAVCTDVLKKRVRKEWEAKQNCELTYVWGYDRNEEHRTKRMIADFPKYNHEFPLLDKDLYKSDCHALLKDRGIARPKMYDLGYNNNNCIACVKGGMGYWNKIRVDFPDVFLSRAKLERELGCRILKECYLDELEPNRGRMSDEVMESCSLMCQVVSL